MTPQACTLYVGVMSHPVEGGTSILRQNLINHCFRQKSLFVRLTVFCVSNHDWLCNRCGGVCSARWPSSYSRSATGETTPPPSSRYTKDIHLYLYIYLYLYLDLYLYLYMCLVYVGFASTLLKRSTSFSSLLRDSRVSMPYSLHLSLCGHDAHASSSPLVPPQLP